MTSIGASKFRKVMKSGDNSKGLEICQLYQVGSICINKNDDVKKGLRLGASKSEYKVVPRDELPSGLPPKRFADRAIETEKNAKPARWLLFQLSLAELKAAKNYIYSILNADKTRLSKSPYGTSLFF